ncbi:ankyrin-1-like [Trichogramma pretiosum]|uniref:ankyrin-1-like n=1 Tax=Trichogramma pretiosum TaxID=7493 RepID=UPI000C718CB2|nr:ankyrin-1-like [Trichogramma pretiosum]
MTDDEKLDVYFSNGGDGGLYNLESEINYHVTIVSNLEKMKKLREKVIQEMEKGQISTEKSRINLFKELDPLISNWKGQYPDLGKLFRGKEMDWLIKEYLMFVKNRGTMKTNLLSFVIECGYKDNPDVDESGKPLLRRTTPLHYAGKRKFFRGQNTVQELFKIYDRFAVNYCDERGYTHFHVACASNCKDIVKKFLELGQDPNCLLQKLVEPPLNKALYYNHKNVAEVLLKNGANPNLANEYGSTPLHVICSRESDDDLVELFFQMCDDSNHSLQVDAREKRDLTPLHVAVYKSNEKAAKFLLQRGANPNLAAEDGSTPLHVICSRECDDDLAEQFFQMCDDCNHSLQVDARIKWDLTPMHIAVCYNNKKAAKFLLQRGANPNLAAEDGSTPLHVICSRECDDDLAELFFQMCDDSNHSLQVDARDKLDNTPLHLAVCNNNKKAAKFLLKRGANPNLADEDGSTPLHVICSRECDDDLVELFFQMCDDSNHPSQVDTRDKLGNPPLHLAVRNSNKKAAKFLLKRGANPNLANKNGYTPLHVICSRECDDDLAEQFFQMCDDCNYPLQVDARKKWDLTPLHLAVYKSNEKAAKFLLQRGANPNLADEDGSTPLHFICARECDDDLAELFFQMCDDSNHSLQVDARDKMDRTPLHLAVCNNNKKAAKFLLKRGFNPN